LEARAQGETILLERLDENGQPMYSSVEAGSQQAQQDEEEELPTYISSPGSATYDSLRDFATKEPEQVARVLKTWMSS
jgi:flagellar biosynthesis/type III secretory pathway M-ring protein FliF/YscJ